MSDSDQGNKPTIACAPNGPYIVEALATLIGADGAPVETEPKMALCRCGGTSNRPFCDGTHAKNGFSDAKSEDRLPDRREDYVGKAITIHDNRGICSHAGHCTDGLPAVFRSGVEPWIDPDAAEAGEIIEVIKRCPSGALSYTVAGTEHRDQDRAPALHVTPHGPYRIEGGVELRGAGSLEGVSEEHRAMCRCGQSKNKPFCDGSHWYANFRDDGRVRVAMRGELEEGRATDVEVDGVALKVELSGDAVRVQAKQGGQAVASEVDPRWGEVLVQLSEVRALGAPAAGASGPSASAPSGGNREEPHNEYIRHLAKHGLSKTGAHGEVAAMGVPRYELPTWDDLQILTAQLHRLPQLEDVAVATELIVGPKADKPLQLDIPLLVSDMSFGALSFEAKVALAKGAELSGTGICSGEGGMLPEEQAENRRYFYELASARFGYTPEQLDRVQAFHFKGGQGAKTGTGGHLPGHKVTEKIAAVRGLEVGHAAISPPRFPDWDSLDDFRRFADTVRERTGGIPIGFKLSAQHIEQDIDAALAVGVDYLILDGRGGATGAAPLLFRDNISVPTIPALARARRHLDEAGADQVTLFITGGLRTPADFTKALALGADGIAIANSAIQAIGCLGSRLCHTNTCPAGVATQDESLRQLLDVDTAAQGLQRFLDAAVHLMCTLARACGHTRLDQLSVDDLTTHKRDMAYLSGVAYGGVVPLT
ncbi:MAG: CDGSH iron-sulfur domain-containing protein [Deltaproteobacteria bacterium]|nr:CDGSH iron-sulfur domain-containing protein [Deltaproteobacteria bacterium]